MAEDKDFRKLLESSKIGFGGIIAMARRPILLITGFITVIAATFILRQVELNAANGDTERSERHLPVGTAIVHYQDYHTIRHKFTGRISATQTSDISFDMAGIVDAVYVDHGTNVKAGDPLAMLDTKRIEFRLAQAQARHTELVARQRLAKATRVRVEGVHTRGNASDQERDEAIANEQAVDAQVANIEAQIRTEELNMQRAILRAPYSGIIDRRLVDEGVVVNAGTPLLRLMASEGMEAHIGFPRKYADRYSVGDFVILTSEDEKQYRAAVSQIAPAVRGETRTQLISFRFEEEALVKDGELVSISIETNEEGRGFWVPLRALTADIRGMWRLYTINETGEFPTVVFENVQIKYVDGARAYVFGSVNDGAKYISEGIERVTPGQAVSVLQKTAIQ